VYIFLLKSVCYLSYPIQSPLLIAMKVVVEVLLL
jgi:hypothetical protein